MNYFPLTTLLAATPVGTQGVNNTSALIAALSGLLGAVIGSTATIIVARISARAEDQRYERRLAAELSTLEQTRIGELERQIREAAVGLSDAWERTIQAHGPYRQMSSVPPQEADEVRARMVEALTRIGSQLNEFLVLPINESLEAQVFAVDEAVDLFRRSINDPKQDVHYRNAVSPAILKLFSILREGGLVRISDKAGKISGTEIPESSAKDLLRRDDHSVPVCAY
jgi:hypothetical protein